MNYIKMNHKLIEQRLKQVIIKLATELVSTDHQNIEPDDIIYIFNENGLYIVDIDEYGGENEI